MAPMKEEEKKDGKGWWEGEIYEESLEQKEGRVGRWEN